MTSFHKFNAQMAQYPVTTTPTPSPKRKHSSMVSPSPTPTTSLSSSSQLSSSSKQAKTQGSLPYLPYNHKYILPPQAHEPYHQQQQYRYLQQPEHYHRHPHMSAYPNPQQFDLYNRKRQRRQAAASLVWNNNNNNTNANNNNNNDHQNNMGRKSTAQPRPVLNVPPRGIGPIVDPNENDVLCGRGGRINSHAGNVQFRDIIHSRKKEYLAPTTKKLEKAHIAAAIVNDIRAMDPPGRFLKEDRDTGLWFDIGDAKAIKKTGQALREDAPDIRPELEGEESSGDEKGAHSPKNAAKKSPKPATSPKVKHSPKQQQTTPFVAPGTSNNNRPMQAHEYQAQMAMPPPNKYPPQQQQGFETRNIPIPAPNMRQVQSNFYTLPNQLYSGAQSVTSKMKSASKQAMAALSQPGHTTGRSARPPDDIAFGRHFHPPEAPQTVLSSDNTMSTISGLSENLSSNMSGGGANAFRPSALMNMSLKSSGVVNDNSLRLSSLQSFGRPSGGRGNNSNGYGESTTGMSGLSGLSGGSLRGDGSLSRSYSFNDMSSIMEGENWKAIMEAGDEMLDEAAVKSILSGSSAKHSLDSGGSIGKGSLLGPRNSSAMSIGGLSMDLASNASSTQWLAAAGLGGPPGDDRTTMSGMSAGLDALDLASSDQSFRM